jgi:mitogen-activated protein kinase kinase kinase kinase 3
MSFVKTGENPGLTYELLEKMGSGSYGSVWKAKNKQTGAIVAIKIVDAHEQQEAGLEGVVKEIKFLMDIKHPNVVKYFDSYLLQDHYLWVRWVSYPV